MENQILKEIKEIRLLLSSLIGTSNLPVKERFSKVAITKAVAEFEKLSIERGEWITEYGIDKIVKKAPNQVGKFIIEKFGFNNYFVRGKSYYFNRRDIVALNNELKLKKINLQRYKELLDDQEKFKKYLETINDPKGKKIRKRFEIPEDLKDIETLPYNHPPKDNIISHIESLKEEYLKFKLAEFIDLYQNETYAIFKFNYYFDSYLSKDLKKRCKNWCNQFNYANHALKEISKIRSEPLYQ